MLKTYIKKILSYVVKNKWVNKLIKYLYHIDFPGSQKYWENRYFHGGNSGAGSYNQLAEYKAEVINKFVKENDIDSVIEFGCGDGNQLSLANYPQYIGFDVSPTAIKICCEKFKDDSRKSFFLYDSLCFFDNHNIFSADLALSLDVIFHLVEEDIFNKYMQDLFNSANKFILIYSSNYEGRNKYHEKDRCFTDWVEQNIDKWKLIKTIENKYDYDPDDSNYTSKSDFYIYKK